MRAKFYGALARNIKAEIYDGDYNSHRITSNYIVSRAFKKLEEHIRISREIVKVSHKLIILKGKSAEEEIKKLNKDFSWFTKGYGQASYGGLIYIIKRML